MIITLDWWQWALPAVVACAFIGLFMGMRIMGLWTVGVFFSGLVAGAFGPKLDLFINKLFRVFAEFFALAADRDESSIPTPTVTIPSPWEPVATGILYALLLGMSWWIARRLAGKGDGRPVDSLLGGVFGALAALIALSQMLGYWADFVRRGGSTSGPATGGGASFTVPEISINLGGLSGSNPLVGVGTAAIGLFLLIIIVYTIWRGVRSAN